MQVVRGETFRRVCNGSFKGHLRASAERSFECGLAEGCARCGCNLRVQALVVLVWPKDKLGMETMHATENDSRVSCIATSGRYARCALKKVPGSFSVAEFV